LQIEHQAIKGKDEFMKRDSFRIYAKYYDHIYLKMKDYKKEAEAVKGVIRQFEEKRSRNLLDVGCGTGEHLKHLSSQFNCVGMDINKGMIDLAKKKVPNAKFRVADMVRFNLKEKFDVITCLFSAIGYAGTFDNMVKTLGNFYKHLSERGLVIVEPWIFRKDFKEGYVTINTYEDDKTKFVRMATSKVLGNKWTILMHYLVAEKGKIKYFKELHKMLAVEYEDYINAFDLAGFKNVRLVKENLWEGSRGLFIANV
jgi:ubiquinone/menaquinone biosynthesis C-methylase UbiE